MTPARFLRSAPALLAAWLAVLCLQIAQPGVLVHHWEHARHASADAESFAAGQHAHALVGNASQRSADAAAHGHADPAHAAPAHPAPAHTGSHDGICDLCAHFAFLGGLQSGRAGIPAVDVAQSLPTSVPTTPVVVTPARERYAARAPPVLLS